MKIGILTFQFVDNYGAMLQAYALQEELKKRGYSVTQINYRNNFKSVIPKAQKKISKIMPFLRKVYFYRQVKAKRQKFNEFRNEYLNIDIERYEGTEINKSCKLDYDVYIVGSDQVWNPNITNNSLAYLFDFVDKDAKKISYAASMGVKCVEDDYKEMMKKYLPLFDGISVREKQVEEYLQNELNIKSNLCLDPVFLLDSKEWSKLCSPQKYKFKYILVYTMERNEVLQKFAIKMAKEKGYKILYLAGGSNESHPNGKLIRNIGPKEFVELINNAEFVCTNSFHGTALSIILEKQFVVTKHSKLNTRLENILRLFNIKNTISDCSQEYSFIDYQKVKEKKIDNIIKSKEFLINHIEGE